MNDELSRSSDEDLRINIYDDPFCEFCNKAFSGDQQNMYVYRMKNVNIAHFVCANCLSLKHVVDVMVYHESAIFKVYKAFQCRHSPITTSTPTSS